MSDSERTDKQYICPLCGHRFKHGDLKCHACPLAIEGKCNVICCPNCGYSFAEESRVVEWLKSKLRIKKTEIYRGRK